RVMPAVDQHDAVLGQHDAAIGIEVFADVHVDPVGDFPDLRLQILRRQRGGDKPQRGGDQRGREIDLHQRSYFPLSEAYATSMLTPSRSCPAQSAYSGILSSFLIWSSDFPCAAISPTRFISSV